MFTSVERTGLFSQPSGFTSFLLARVLAMAATQIQAVVVAWQVYDLTRDPMALAYVGLAQFLPMLFLLLPAGDLIDRLPRKRILGVSWCAGAVCSALLWWLSGHGHAGVFNIYAVLLLFGASRAFSGPAMQSLLPQLVTREQLPQAIATNSMVMRGAAIGAPLLGGLLYGAGGSSATYSVCMLAFVVGALLLCRVHVLPSVVASQAQIAASQKGNTNIWERFGIGIRFIFRRPIILV